MLSAILAKVENDSRYNFFQNSDKLREFICEYKEVIGK